MRTLLQQVRVTDRNSPFNGQVVDILLSLDGTVEQIGTALQADDAVQVHVAGASVCPAWMDVGAQACEPGFEHRETLRTLSEAARAGGFGDVAVAPNTHPAIHGSTEVAYVSSRQPVLKTRIHSLGAISMDCAGKDLAELYEMHEAGVLAFTDGSKPVQDSGLMLRAMQYAKAFGGLVMNTPFLKSLAPSGQMHEGMVSTSLGLPGLPEVAEELMVIRDIKLAEYADAPLHVAQISTAKGLQHIREAKAKGLQVTCSVAVYHAIFDDSAMLTFDTNMKVNPPLRSKEDVKAIQEGLKDGTIDFLTSGHTPWDTEAKELEFPYAKFGMLGLETALPLSLTYLADVVGVEKLVELWSAGPRKVLNLSVPTIEVGQKLSVVLFDPSASWTFTKADIRSMSKNTPFVGHAFRGKVLGMYGA